MIPWKTPLAAHHPRPLKSLRSSQLIEMGRLLPPTTTLSIAAADGSRQTPTTPLFAQSLGALFDTNEFSQRGRRSVVVPRFKLNPQHA
jgi:hypothetical protein